MAVHEGVFKFYLGNVGTYVVSTCINLCGYMYFPLIITSFLSTYTIQLSTTLSCHRERKYSKVCSQDIYLHIDMYVGILYQPLRDSWSFINCLTIPSYHMDLIMSSPYNQHYASIVHIMNICNVSAMWTWSGPMLQHWQSKEACRLSYPTPPSPQNFWINVNLQLMRVVNSAILVI